LLPHFEHFSAMDRQDMAAGLPNGKEPPAARPGFAAHHLIQINFTQPMGDYC
jgi:hypothetical protein